MKTKVAGALLIVVGVALLAWAALKIALVVLTLIKAELSAYAWGRLTAHAVLAVLFTLLGIKAFKAGRKRFAGKPAPSGETSA